MVTTKHLCRVRTDKDTFYLLSREVTDEESSFHRFELSLSDGNTTWHGLVTAEYIKSYSKKIHLGYEELLTQTWKAFTNDKTTTISFVYEVTPVSKGVRRFTWKRCEGSEDIKFKLGSIELQEGVPPSAGISEIFEFALDSIGTLENKVKQLKDENHRLRTERESDIEKLSKLAVSKDDIERELYSKFVLVLNEKKAFIRDLQEQLNALNGSAPEGTCQDRNKDSETLATTSADYVDDTEDDVKCDNDDIDSEYNTDEETQSTERAAKKRCHPGVDVSLSASDVPQMLEDNNSDETSDLPVVTRRRGQVTSKLQKPTQPRIPRAPSGKTTGKQTSTTRSKRHLAEESTRVSCDDTLNETCDLMDDV